MTVGPVLMLRYLWWKVFHRPVYHPGQKVVNRYDTSGKPKILFTYLGPYIWWQDDKCGLSELWRTVDDFEVAVGYYWL